MIELQAHHCMTYNCEPDSCAVCFIPAKQLSLQESNQLIGIKMPTSGFSKNIWFLIPISRVLYQVPRTKASSSNATKKRFY